MSIRFKVCFSIITVALVAAVLAGCGGDPPAPTSGSSATAPSASSATVSSPTSTTPAPPPFEQEDFSEKRTINFVSSDPPNNALLNARPAFVTVNFRCKLGSGSFISVKRDELEVATGPMITGADDYSVSVAINQAVATTGNYKVRYTVYFIDGSYFDGSFGFSVLLPETPGS